MRELKFRAWLKKEKCYGKVLGIDFYEGAVRVHYQQGELVVFNISIPFEDVVIEQYTGLKDKNGKEIYEGDIFEDDYNGGYEVVKWIDERSAFCLCYMGYERDVEEFYTRCTNEMEVIGNIHENKELLREE